MSCKSVLIVEDDQSIRQMLQDVLEINGYTTYTAVNGDDGIKQLDKILPNPCVVLLDLMMPGTNGWQFLDVQRTTPRFSKIPIVLCSAYRESALAIKASDFVPKPVQLDTLLGAIQKFCS